MQIIKDIAYGADPAQKLDLYLPCGKAFSVVLYFHGGGIEAGDKSGTEKFASYLTDNGIAFVTANYRMYPAAHFPDFVVDAASAAAWVKNNMAQYGDVRRLFITGSSAGAYLSMMLCFDTHYLKNAGIDPMEIGGYIFDAGQPTAHFNVLRERGIDTRRVIVDETAPLYYVGTEPDYPPMLFLSADQDMENRHEQNQLMLSTLRHFRYDMTKITWKVLRGTHCHYVDDAGFDGISSYLRHLAAFVRQYERME